MTDEPTTGEGAMDASWAARDVGYRYGFAAGKREGIMLAAAKIMAELEALNRRCATEIPGVQGSHGEPCYFCRAREGAIHVALNVSLIAGQPEAGTPSEEAEARS